MEEGGGGFGERGWLKVVGVGWEGMGGVGGGRGGGGMSM